MRLRGWGLYDEKPLIELEEINFACARNSNNSR